MPQRATPTGRPTTASGSANSAAPAGGGSPNGAARGGGLPHFTHYVILARPAWRIQGYAGRARVARVWCVPEPAIGVGVEVGLAPNMSGVNTMGKYKQWLHHQEIGRRLRDQINTLEQERARVQQMAPAKATSLPELDNPIISALPNFPRAGNKLSNIDPIKAAMPKMDPALDQRRPAPSTVMPAAPNAAGRPAAPNAAVVASLQARAEQMPSDPLDQMRELSRTHGQDGPARNGASTPGSGAKAAAESHGGSRQ